MSLEAAEAYADLRQGIEREVAKFIRDDRMKAVPAEEVSRVAQPFFLGTAAICNLEMRHRAAAISQAFRAAPNFRVVK